MTALDRVLDVLAAAPASDASYEPYGTNDPSKCWRCLGPAGDGASGVCDACRVVLLGDGPIEPSGNGRATFSPMRGVGYFQYDREGSFRSEPPTANVRLDSSGPWRPRAFIRRDGDEEWIELPVTDQGVVNTAVLPPEALTSGRYTFRLERGYRITLPSPSGS